LRCERSERNGGWGIILRGLLFFFAAPCVGHAQVDLARDRGWLSLGAGGGRVEVVGAGASTETAFMLDLSGGLWLTDRLGLGVRLGGWTIQGFNFWRPEAGESVSEVFAQARFRPSVRSPLSVRLESGWASHVVNGPVRAPFEGDVLGWRVGAAWRLSALAGLTIVPSLVCSWGGAGPAMADGERFDYRGIGLLLDVEWSW